MNNKELVNAIAQDINTDTVEVQKLIDSFNNAVVNMLNENDVLSIKGFGSFEVKKRLERIISNPATQQKMLTPPKLSLVFKPSSSFKEEINNTFAEP